MTLEEVLWGLKMLETLDKVYEPMKDLDDAEKASVFCCLLEKIAEEQNMSPMEFIDMIRPIVSEINKNLGKTNW